MRRSVFATLAFLAFVGLAAWMLIAPDALIRYPDDLDQTLTYRGVIAVPDAPGTHTATVEPMTITRHIWVASSTFSTARVRETVTTRFGGEVHVQHNGFVIDRRTMKIRSSSNNFAFTTDNPVDRRHAYGPSLPMRVDAAGKYRLWSDDTGQAYNVVGDGTTVRVHGVKLVTLTANVGPRSVTDAYARFLDLPESATLQTLAKVADVDLQAALNALSSVVSPIAMADVIDATNAPIPLHYSLASTGRINVEPRTGGIVDVENVANRLAVKPELNELHLDTILGAYAQDPVVHTVLDQLDELAARPAEPAMNMQYAQTPASVRSAVSYADGLRKDAHRVNVDVPLALAALAFLLLVGAALPPRKEAAHLHLLPHHGIRERHAA